MKENLESKQALFVAGIETGLSEKIPSTRKKLTDKSFQLSINIASVYLFGEMSQKNLSGIFPMSSSRIGQRISGVLFAFYKNLPNGKREEFKKHFPYYEWTLQRDS